MKNDLRAAAQFLGEPVDAATGFLFSMLHTLDGDTDGAEFYYARGLEACRAGDPEHQHVAAALTADPTPDPSAFRNAELHFREAAVLMTMPAARIPEKRDVYLDLSEKLDAGLEFPHYVLVRARERMRSQP